jgi:hypothetical protein
MAVVSVSLGFVPHEMGHRFIARKFSCIAEYRMWPAGLIIALVSVPLLSRVKQSLLFFESGHYPNLASWLGRLLLMSKSLRGDAGASPLIFIGVAI